jgi:hypothetical protein
VPKTVKFAVKELAEVDAWARRNKIESRSEAIRLSVVNINLCMEDVHTGRIEFAHSVDIRGNTDESWLHGLNYMIRNYVLEQP